MWSSPTSINVKFTSVISFGLKFVMIVFFFVFFCFFFFLGGGGGKIDVTMMTLKKSNSKAVNREVCAFQI